MVGYPTIVYRVFYTSEVVQDFFRQQYVSAKKLSHEKWLVFLFEYLDRYIDPYWRFLAIIFLWTLPIQRLSKKKSFWAVPPKTPRFFLLYCQGDEKKLPSFMFGDDISLQWVDFIPPTSTQELLQRRLGAVAWASQKRPSLKPRKNEPWFCRKENRESTEGNT